MAASSSSDGRTTSRRVPTITLLLIVVGVVALLILWAQRNTGSGVTVTRVATGLENPRGVAVLPDGRLLVVQAGNGVDTDDPLLETGSLSIFEDLNGDGDYDDEREIEPIFSEVASYNTLTQFGTGHDEVGGLGDIVLLEDGRIFLTRDDPSVGYAPDGSPRGINVAELNPEFEFVRNLIARNGTLNAVDFDAERDVLYVAESGANRLIEVAMDGAVRVVAAFPTLEQGQQAVPSGLAVDPTTGDVLVVLFSGQYEDESGEIVSYAEGASRIMRVDPATGEQVTEIGNLTTAVDVAVDGSGNVFVVELTDAPYPPRMSRDFDLSNPDAPAHAGGYNRFSGTVTMYPFDGAEPVALAREVDAPTNLTLSGGALFVSVGQGTPGRSIVGDQGTTRIVGEIYRITGFTP
jgi:DNA-binding beta-propeller fold protein YncE